MDLLFDQEADESLGEQRAALGIKKRKEPSSFWYCWACCNNERGCILAFYVVALILIFATIGLVWENQFYTVELPDSTLSAPVLFPPFENCVIQAPSVNPACIRIPGSDCLDGFTENTSPSAGVIAIVVVLSLDAFMLPFGIAYASVDLSGRIIYRRMEAYYRGTLFSVVLIFCFLLGVTMVTMAYGTSYYALPNNANISAPVSQSCFDFYLAQLEAQLKADYNLGGETINGFRSELDANLTAFSLTIAAFILVVLNLFLYISLFCATRTWQDTRGFNPKSVRGDVELF